MKPRQEAMPSADDATAAGQFQRVAAAEAGPASADAIEGRHLTKTFPGVKALDDVSITVHRGEILALVGENGAGKSTLVNILSGVYEPDSGEIRIGGKAIRLSGPRHARQLGIGVVHQELSLLGELTVAENVLLTREPVGPMRLIRTAQLYDQAKQALADINPSLDPDIPVRLLSPAQRQMVEIAKAWASKPQVLILDEPTSSLSEAEVQLLFSAVRGLRARGVGIIFISHRMEEIYALADRATVLKDGKLVGTVLLKDTTQDELLRLMVGREIRQTFPSRRHLVRHGTAPPLLELKGVGDGKQVREVSLTLERGEILGIGGLEGQGQRELVRGLFGIEPFRKGRIMVDGRSVSIRCPQDAIRSGIAFVPDDRKAEGLVLPLSVGDNIALASLWQRQRWGFVEQRKEREIVRQYVSILRLKVTSELQRVRQLSGGNQQKAIFARWLLKNPRILVLHEPTRGIDVEAKMEIYHLLRNMAGQGVGIIMVTSDMLELMGVSDRIVVLYEGHVAGEIPAEEASEEALITLSSGLPLGARVGSAAKDQAGAGAGPGREGAHQR